jgi:ATP-dependent DNA helicase RecG
MPVAEVDSALNASPSEIGELLLAITEDQWFDRKSGRISPRDLANAICGMVNAEGGHLIIGLENGQVEGFSAGDKKINELRQAGNDFLHPPVLVRTNLIRCLRSDGSESHILDLDVSPSGQVHATSKDEVFLRVGDETRRLRYAERQELEFDKGQAEYESRLSGGFSFADLYQRLADRYLEVTGHPNLERLFRARGLALNDELTIAGCLLFAEYPQRRFPEAFLRVLKHRGDRRQAGSRQQLIADETIEGPIPMQLQKAADLVQDLQPTRRALAESGRFESIGLIPRDAWLEGLVNAAVHRSYSMAGDHIRVEIFDNRIEISSPGRFPGLVKLDDPLSVLRFARNPRVARVCSDLDFGQELGEGIRRMYEEMSLAGLGEPEYRQTEGSVILTLSGDPVDRGLEARLPEEHRQIRGLLRAGGRLSTGEIADAIDVSRPATIKRLRRLEEEGLIEWRGKSSKDPRAYWKLPGN